MVTQTTLSTWEKYRFVVGFQGQTVNVLYAGFRTPIIGAPFHEFVGRRPQETLHLGTEHLVSPDFEKKHPIRSYRPMGELEINGDLVTALPDKRFRFFNFDYLAGLEGQSGQISAEEREQVWGMIVRRGL